MASPEQVLQALLDAIHHQAQANPSASQLRDLAEAYTLLTDEVEDEDDEEE
jgi:hypothetical protein